MAGWLHGVFVGDWLFVFPLCGFSLSLFCNYIWRKRSPARGTSRKYADARCTASRCRPYTLTVAAQHQETKR